MNEYHNLARNDKILLDMDFKDRLRNSSYKSGSDPIDHKSKSAPSWIRVCKTEI